MTQKYNFKFFPPFPDPISGKALAEQAENAINDIGEIVLIAEEKADQANGTASNALTIANNALNTANTAITNSQQAISTANTAEQAAAEAGENARQAIQTANTALDNSINAIDISSAASQTSSQALESSQQAVETANEAKDESSQALSQAETAIMQSAEAVNIASGLFVTNDDVVNADLQFSSGEKSYLTNAENTNFPEAMPVFFTVNINDSGNTVIQFVSTVNTQLFFHRTGMVDGNESVTWGEWKEAGGSQGDGFDSGTTMPFMQPAAPTGWTRDTDPALDDSALRLVTSSTVTGGGANGFVSRMASAVAITGTVGNTTLSEAQIPWHHHGLSGWATIAQNGGSDANFSKGSNWAPVVTYANGGSGAHNHSLSINALNLNVKYVDLIVCSKD